MFAVRKSARFDRWLQGLRDPQAKARILARITRARLGNLGDVASVGKNVSEMRIDYVPGYRLYFLRQGDHLILLLAGGTNGSQKRDIEAAHMLAAQWSE